MAAPFQQNASCDTFVCVCLSSSMYLSWVSIYFTLPASLYLLDYFWVCVCAWEHVYTYLPVSPSKCVSFFISYYLPPSFSVWVSFLSLSPSVLSLSPSSTVCLCRSIYDYHDCPVNQGLIMTFMGPALLPSWALHVWKKKNYNTFYDCIGIEANIIQDGLITVHSLLLYLAFLLIKKI